ncbi:MAG: OmpP1/FadL family transporter [Syntrophaceae bacterium]
MMKKLCLVFLSVLISLALTSSVFAAGFALTEPSARANGLGGATVAMGGDASCLFSNPAAITRLPGIQTQLGVVVLQPKLDVTTYGTAPTFTDAAVQRGVKTSMENNTFYAPSGYITSQMSDKLWMGVGAFSRFGLGTEFAQTWPGRYNAYNSRVRSYEVNPNVAYKFTDKLSLSAGVSAMYFDIKLQKKIAGVLFGGTSDVDQKFTGDSVGYGWNASLHYQAFDWVSIGFSYRSQVKQHVDGNANFSGQSNAVLLSRFPSNVQGKGTITLPDEFFLGVAIKPAERLTWEVGGVMYGWSSYDQLKIEFEEPVNLRDTSVSSKNWKDSWRFQTGLEYKATDWLDLRLSYVYDQSPIPDTTIDYILPDSDRNVFGIGVGFHGKSWTLDASFNYLIFNDRNIAARTIAQGNTADFMPRSEVRNGDCLLYGLSFGYKF